MEAFHVELKDRDGTKSNGYVLVSRYWTGYQSLSGGWIPTLILKETTFGAPQGFDG